MSTAETEIPDACAACGKAGDGLKKCTSCQQVKYCGRDCQSSDWKNHQRACKKKAAELHDEALFKQPPRQDDCPICFLILPASGGGKHYQPCCGQTVCEGCIFTATNVEKLKVCPFCREALWLTGRDRSSEEKALIERYTARVEANDAGAMNALGTYYIMGTLGLQRDPGKARELFERAGKLGSAHGYFYLANMYRDGNGVARDPKKAKHYWELAAMEGEVYARYNLGLLELMSNNHSRAVKHFAIAAMGGHEEAMKKVTAGRQFITDQEYKETLRSFIEVTKEVKSEQRDKANEFREVFGIIDPKISESEREERRSQWMRANGHLFER